MEDIMKNIVFKNNSSIPFMIEDLGTLVESNEAYNASDSIDHEEMCTSTHLKNSVKNGIISIIIDDIKLDINDALRFLTIESAYDDSNNERWKYDNGMKITIAEFTQLRIHGRPLDLSSGCEIILEEGADLIID